jgi:diacylglycerol kinase family enzyme
MHFSFQWRLLAAMSLVIYGAIAFLIIRFLAHNLLFAIIFGITATLAVYAVWMIYSGEHERFNAGWRMLVISVAAIVLELFIYVRRADDLRALAGVILLTGLYVASFNMLRSRYWRQARAAGAASGETANFVSPYLIVNPKSGDGRAIRAHIPELAERMGVHVMVMQQEDTVESLARKAAESGADVLGISGGDGSIGAVAKVAMEYGLPIVVLPGGTKCHFARDIGLDPKRIADSLAGFHGVRRTVDAGSINGRMFLNNASFGLYADIVDHPEYREHKSAVTRDVVRGILSGERNLYDLNFTNGTEEFHQAVEVLVGVNEYETMSLFTVGQREHMNEKVLQVTALTNLNDSLLKKLVSSISVKKLKDGHIRDFFQWITPEFWIRSMGPPLVVGVDGEREVYANPVRIQILPNALTLYVPPEGERGRQQNPFSGKMVGRLWHAAYHG